MKRILIVDDDAAILEGMEFVLEQRYAVRTAANGRAALAALAEGGIDCVILDMMMPVLDGRGFIREASARGSTTPVIIVSAGHDVVAEARALGAADYLAKPFDLGELELKLTRLLGASAG